MSVDSVQCWECVKMNFGVEEGIPREFLDYDFVAQDALEFEEQLAQARDVSFIEFLYEPLVVGSHIVVTGTPSEDIPWFAINLGCDKNDMEHEIAVQFNVRMPQAYVVRNTKRHYRWGVEENTSFRLFPFKMGRPFTIEILIDEKETYWAVDGVHYCSYAHRTPSAFNVSWIQVMGVRDASITVNQGASVYPAFADKPREVDPSSDMPAVESADQTNAVDKNEVPMKQKRNSKIAGEYIWKPNCIARLSHGVPPGYQVVIIGRLRPMLYQFTLELMDRPFDWPLPNIIASVSVRPYDESHRERQLVVLNTFLGAWGSERRQRTAKLVPGTKSTFRIVRNQDEWSVFADDILIGELEHRAAPEGVKALRIRGDLYPESIFLCPLVDPAPGDNELQRSSVSVAETMQQ